MKFILKIIYYIFFFITACRQAENIPEIKNTITFKTGFEASWVYSGSFIDPKTHTEYIYFADPETTKCIKLFKLTGELTDSIPLKQTLHFLGVIKGISMRSRDTIIINSDHTNLLTVINRKGEFIKKILIDSLIKQSNGDHYELYSSLFQSKLINNSILFFSELRYNDKENEPEGLLESDLYFRRNLYKAPFFCKISDYATNHPTAEFGLKNYYSEFAKPTDDFSESPRFTCVNNNVFLWTRYSDKLFIANPNTLTLKNKIKIKSRYTKIGVEPPHINKNTINHIQEINDSIQSTAAQFGSIFYDVNKSSYYLLVYHSTRSTLEREIGYKRMPYSIIKIDTTFTNFKEYKMNADTFFGWFSIMTTQGLFINNPSKNIHESNTYTTFTRFEFKD